MKIKKLCKITITKRKTIYFKKIRNNYGDCTIASLKPEERKEMQKKEDLFMKRRKLFALLMTAAMAVSSMSMAVNVFAEEDTTEEAAES